MPHQHKNQGKLFNVRIDIGVPGSEIVVNRDQHEDVYVALRDAFDAANANSRTMAGACAARPRPTAGIYRPGGAPGSRGALWLHPAHRRQRTVFSFRQPGEHRFRPAHGRRRSEVHREMASEGPQAKRVSRGASPHSAVIHAAALAAQNAAPRAPAPDSKSAKPAAVWPSAAHRRRSLARRGPGRGYGPQIAQRGRRTQCQRRQRRLGLAQKPRSSRRKMPMVVSPIPLPRALIRFSRSRGSAAASCRVSRLPP